MTRISHAEKMERKGKGKEENIAEIFEQWKKEALSKDECFVPVKGSDKTVRLKKDEIKTFRRCWTDDEAEPLWKARKELNPKWFVSKGSLLLVDKGEVKFQMPTFTGKKERLKYNYQKNDERYFIYLSHIYNLTNNVGLMDDARKDLEKEGLKAIKKYDLHHEDGYKTLTEEESKDPQKVHDNEWQNNQNTQFLIPKTHKVVTYSLDSGDIKKIASVTDTGMYKLIDLNTGDTRKGVIDPSIITETNDNANYDPERAKQNRIEAIENEKLKIELYKSDELRTDRVEPNNAKAVPWNQKLYEILMKEAKEKAKENFETDNISTWFLVGEYEGEYFYGKMNW